MLLTFLFISAKSDMRPAPQLEIRTVGGATIGDGTT